MKSLYQFEIGLLGTHGHDESNVFQWIEQFKTIFVANIHESKITELINSYSKQESLSREWYYFMAQLLENQLDFSISEFEIEMIIPLHNRYQKAIYFQIFTKEVVTMDQIDQFKNRLLNHQIVINDSYTFRYKEQSLGMTQNRFANDYDEMIYLCNPVVINDDSTTMNNHQFKPLNHDSYVMFDLNFRPKKSENDRRFKRGIHLEYALTSHDYSVISSHFTSMFILFHRSNAYAFELMNMDNALHLVYAISEKMSGIWSKGRAYVMSLEGHRHRRRFNQVFFKIMELNTLIDGEINQLKSSFSSIKDTYDTQYERVLSNIKTTHEELNQIYQDMLMFLTYPYQFRENILHCIKEFKEPTDMQMKRLKELFDAKSQTFMEASTFSLTIIVAIWGFMTFYYSSIFKTESVLDNVLLFGFPIMPMIITTLLVLSILATLYYLIIYPQKRIVKFSKVSTRLVQNHPSQSNLHHNFQIMLHDYQKSIQSNDQKEKYIPELAELLSTIIIFKTYVKNFDYKEHIHIISTL